MASGLQVLNRVPRYVKIILVFVILAIFVVVSSYYGTKTLSGVRAYVLGESIWTKAQKEATRHLLEYTFYEDEQHYKEFDQTVELHYSFLRSRKSITSGNPDYEVAKKGFEASPLLTNRDIDLSIWVGKNFHEMPYINESFSVWEQADQKIAELDSLGSELHKIISSGRLTDTVRSDFVRKIAAIDEELTELESTFSTSLTNAAHFIRQMIFWIIAGSGLLLIISGYIVTARSFRKIDDLNDKLQLLSLVGAKTTDLVLITDANEQITWVNKTFEQVTGYTLEEVRGKVPGEFLQGPETSEEAQKRFAKAIDNKKSIQQRILNYSKEGEKIWLDITIDPIFNKDGECTHFIAIERDVTERAAKQAEIRESLERYNIVARATSDTIWDYDLESGAIQYNDVIHDMFGYDMDEVSHVREWWEEKIHPEDQEEVKEKIAQVMEGGIDRFQLEYRFRCADGSYKHIYDRAFVVTDDGGEPTRIIGAMQDITERKEAQKQQERSRKLLQAITENAELPIWVRDQEGKMILANKEWKRMFNLEDEEVIDKKIQNLLNEDTFREFIANDKKVISSGAPRTFYEQVEINDDKRYFVTSMFPLEDVPGLGEAVGGLAIDITARKQAEEKLKATEQRMREIIEHSTNMFYRHTADHVLTYVSPQSEQFLGCDPDEAMIRWTEFITDHPINEKGFEITQRAIDTGETQDPFELQLQKNDGEIIWVEVNEAPIVKEGETTAIVGSLTDITQRKQARQEISEALKEKETLLAEVHHRVKNNMAVVSGMMQLQAFKEDNQELKEKLLDNVARIGTMASIHEHLYQSETFASLNFSKNLENIIQKLIDTIHSEADLTVDTSLQSIELNINQALPCSLIVSEVVTNTLKHAFKGKEKGNIKITLSEENNLITLIIEDDGVGLPSDIDVETKGRSLGFHLIEKLSKQLNADFSYGSPSNGTKFQLSFERAEVKGSGGGHF